MDARDRSREHARTALLLGRFDAAERLAREALAHDANEPRVWFVLGQALLWLGRVEEAIDALRETVRLAPEAPEGHAMLGLALQQADRVSWSIEPLREALRLRHEFPLASARLAVALAHETSGRDVSTLVQRALASSPDDPDVLVACAHASTAAGDPGLGERIARRAVAAAPENVDAFRVLAEALRKLGRFDDAAQLASEAILHSPNAGIAWLERGIANYHRGARDDSARDLEHAARWLGEHWTVVAYRAKLAPDPEAARAILDAALATRRDRRLEALRREFEGEPSSTK